MYIACSHFCSVLSCWLWSLLKADELCSLLKKGFEPLRISKIDGSKFGRVPEEMARKRPEFLLQKLNLEMFSTEIFPKHRIWDAQAQWQWRTDKPLKGAEKLPNMHSESQRVENEGLGSLKRLNLFTHLVLLLKPFPHKGLVKLKHSGSEGWTSH